MAVTNPIVETTTSKDGMRIGWARTGHGPPLVKRAEIHDLLAQAGSRVRDETSLSRF